MVLLEKQDILGLDDFKEVNQFLANRIKEARLAKRISVASLSEKSGVASDYISKVENGKKNKVSLYIYLKLIYYLDIDCELFLKGLNDLEPFRNK